MERTGCPGRPAGSFLKIEARAISPDRTTKFYVLGNWSPDNQIFPRASVRNQHDADGRVDTDTLVVKRLSDAAQIRVTLGGTNGALPELKFLGACFANTENCRPSDLPIRRRGAKSSPRRNGRSLDIQTPMVAQSRLARTLARRTVTARNEPDRFGKSQRGSMTTILPAQATGRSTRRSPGVSPA